MTERKWRHFPINFIYTKLWFYSVGGWVYGSKNRIKLQIHFIKISFLNRRQGDPKGGNIQCLSVSFDANFHGQIKYCDYHNFNKFYNTT